MGMNQPSLDLTCACPWAGSCGRGTWGHGVWGLGLVVPGVRARPAQPESWGGPSEDLGCGGQQADGGHAAFCVIAEGVGLRSPRGHSWTPPRCLWVSAAPSENPAGPRQPCPPQGPEARCTGHLEASRFLRAAGSGYSLALRGRTCEYACPGWSRCTCPLPGMQWGPGLPSAEQGP